MQNVLLDGNSRPVTGRRSKTTWWMSKIRVYWWR